MERNRNMVTLSNNRDDNVSLPCTLTKKTRVYCQAELGRNPVSHQPQQWPSSLLLLSAYAVVWALVKLHCAFTVRQWLIRAAITRINGFIPSCVEKSLWLMSLHVTSGCNTSPPLFSLLLSLSFLCPSPSCPTNTSVFLS